MRFLLRTVLIGALLCLPITSFAQRRGGGWVDQLLNGNNDKCCANNDGDRLGGPDWDNLGHIQDGPDGNSGYRVFEDNKWYDVSNKAVVTGRNQDGIPRVWWNREYNNGITVRKTVRCFLKGIEG